MTAPDDEAREALRRAQALHAERRTDDAIREAQRALELRPDFVEALTYLGTTLVTRKLAFPQGLALLERAAVLAPGDPGVSYSLGWCYEFAAYRLEKQGRSPLRQAQGRLNRDPVELYERAAEQLQRCIDLDAEQGLKDDAQDLLDAVMRRLE